MDNFQTRVVTSAKKVATRVGEKEPLPGNLKRRIKEDFVDTLCFLFDGVLNSAMGTPEISKRRPSRITRVSSSRMVTLKDIVSALDPATNTLQPRI
jgi:exocyst complex component 2